METLKLLRKEKKLTQAKVSSDLDISRAAYNAYELGTRQPDPDMLKKMACYYGVSTDFLLGLTSTRTAQPEFNIPDDLKDIPVAFHEGLDGLSQEDIDDVRDFIEFVKNRKKK